MDTRTAKIDVPAKIDEIKRFMPATYSAIKTKAEEVGNDAFVLVRRGLRGEPNCFYAFEAGRVVGTVFTGKNLDGTGIQDEVARYLVQFGVSNVVIFASDRPAP